MASELELREAEDSIELLQAKLKDAEKALCYIRQTLRESSSYRLGDKIHTIVESALENLRR